MSIFRKRTPTIVPTRAMLIGAEIGLPIAEVQIGPVPMSLERPVTDQVTDIALDSVAEATPATCVTVATSPYNRDSEEQIEAIMAYDLGDAALPEAPMADRVEASSDDRFHSIGPVQIEDFDTPHFRGIRLSMSDVQAQDDEPLGEEHMMIEPELNKEPASREEPAFYYEPVSRSAPGSVTSVVTGADDLHTRLAKNAVTSLMDAVIAIVESPHARQSHVLPWKFRASDLTFGARPGHALDPVMIAQRDLCLDILRACSTRIEAAHHIDT